MKIWIAILAVLGASKAHAAVYPSEIIDNALINPWSRRFPQLPNPSEELRRNAGAEMAARPTVREAMTKLASVRGNNDWFTGLDELEHAHAIWCLQVVLCHPHDDVQIRALRALRSLGDSQAVPFLILYAEYMAVPEGGSENAALHGMIHEETAAALSALTGIAVPVRGQDVEALKRGIRLWRAWLVRNESA